MIFITAKFQVRPEDADGLAALHEQRLVVLEPAQRGDDRVEGLPRARCAPRAAVDDELGRVLGDIGVQIVAQHPQRGLLGPAAAFNSGGDAHGAAR